MTVLWSVQESFETKRNDPLRTRQARLRGRGELECRLECARDARKGSCEAKGTFEGHGGAPQLPEGGQDQSEQEGTKGDDRVWQRIRRPRFSGLGRHVGVLEE